MNLLSYCRRIAIVCTALFALSIMAEPESEDEKEEKIEEIHVSASRVRSEGHLIYTMDVNEWNQFLHAPDIFRRIPGLAVSVSGNRGALTQLRVRGGESDHVMVMIDGIQANDPASEFDFGTLSLTGVNKIEVLNGPQSAIWGSDALAGVIALDTAPKRNEKKMDVGLGINRTQDVRARYSKRSDKSSWLLSAEHTSSAGSNVSLIGDETDPFSKNTIHASSSNAIGNWNTRLVVRTGETEVNYDPSPYPLYIPRDGKNHSLNNRTLYGFSLSRESLARWQPSIEMSQSRTGRRHYSDDQWTNSTVGTRNQIVLSNNVFLHERQTFNLTGEYRSEIFVQNGFASQFGDPNQRRKSFSTALAAEYVFLSDRSFHSISIRRDLNQEFKNSTAWRVASTIDFSLFAWFAMAGVGTKNPSFIQRYGFTPDTFIGNADLKPETGKQVQIGIRKDLDKTALSLALFNDDLQNEIDGFVFDTAGGGFTAKNLDKLSKRRGVELLVDRKLKRLNFGLSATLVNSYQDNTREVRRPKYTAGAWLDVKPNKNTNFAAELTYNGEQLDNDYSEYPAIRRTLDSFSLLSLRINRRMNTGISIGLTIENALDENYQEIWGYRSPGRSVMTYIGTSL